MNELITQFLNAATEAGCDVHLVSSGELEQIVSFKTANMEEHIIANTLDGRQNFTTNELAEKKIGISRAYAAVAENGSLIIDLTSHNHALSLLPEQSIIAVMASEIYPTLQDWLITNPKPESWLILTGPSKTADIEQVLVYGAHGPTHLTILVESDK